MKVFKVSISICTIVCLSLFLTSIWSPSQATPLWKRPPEQTRSDGPSTHPHPLDQSTSPALSQPTVVASDSRPLFTSASPVVEWRVLSNEQGEDTILVRLFASGQGYAVFPKADKRAGTFTFSVTPEEVIALLEPLLDEIPLLSTTTNLTNHELLFPRRADGSARRIIDGNYSVFNFDLRSLVLHGVHAESHGAQEIVVYALSSAARENNGLSLLPTLDATARTLNRWASDAADMARIE